MYNAGLIGMILDIEACWGASAKTLSDSFIIFFDISYRFIYLLGLRQPNGLTRSTDPGFVAKHRCSLHPGNSIELVGLKQQHPSL